MVYKPQYGVYKTLIEKGKQKIYTCKLPNNFLTYYTAFYVFMIYCEKLN